MRITIFNLFLATIAASYLTSCDKPPAPQPPPTQSQAPQASPGPKIEVEVFRDIYAGFGDPGVSPMSYEVTVKFTNTTTTPFEFDTVEGAFLPENGTPLANRSHPYDASKQTEPGKYSGSDLKSSTVAPGASEVFHFTTDGYTGKLLSDAGNAPLRFGFTVAHRRKIVFGPLVGDLPQLNGLPLRPRDPKGAPLDMKKPEAGKLYDKTQPRR